MAVTGEPSHRTGQGEGVLARISSEMVRAMKQYYGKGPDRAKSYMLDDFLLVVMRGGVLPVEQTMLESGAEDLVREFRQRFENEMAGRLTSIVEQTTGRTVVNYQSQVMFDPDIVVEVFFFDRQAEPEQIAATARSQLDDSEAGEVASSTEPASDPDDADR